MELNPLVWYRESAQFLSEVRVEYRKVTWPTQKEAVAGTIGVVDGNRQGYYPDGLHHSRAQRDGAFRFEFGHDQGKRKILFRNQRPEMNSWVDGVGPEPDRRRFS